jgi:hypothetical protein
VEIDYSFEIGRHKIELDSNYNMGVYGRASYYRSYVRNRIVCSIELSQAFFSSSSSQKRPETIDSVGAVTVTAQSGPA